jgi:hypothetical protein
MDTENLYFTEQLSSLFRDYEKLEHSLTVANLILNYF